jgi:WD40-like Beta Propeller Repeat
MAHKQAIVACPYLGLPNDSGSHYAEPSDAHRCYSPKEPGEIDLEHQKVWCLGGEYSRCERFVESEKVKVAEAVSPPPPQLAASASSSANGFQKPKRAQRPATGRRPIGGLEIGLWGMAVVLGLIALYTAWTVLSAPRSTSAVALAMPTSTATARPTLTPSPEATVTLTPTLTPSPLPSLAALVIPTPPDNGTTLTLSPDALSTGWVATNELSPHWGDSNLHAGSFQGQRYASVMRFKLANLPPGSKILFAALELTGKNAAHVGTSGQWRLELIATDPNQAWSQLSVEDVTGAQALSIVGRPLDASELSVGNINRFEFDETQLGLLEKLLATGEITLRLTGPDTAGDDLFTWDAGSGAANSVTAPTLYLVAVPAPFTVVTNTPTPANVLTAAADVVRSTDLARTHGTPTPFPPGVVTATPGGGPLLIAPPPTAGNAATARAISAYATAVAITTGTFTPTPPNVVVVYPTATPVFISADQLSIVATSTPAVSYDYLATPIPGYLSGKILALSNRYSGGSASAPIVMNDDGSVAGILSGMDYYQAAFARESYSPDRTQRAIVAPDERGVLQIWIENLNGGSRIQVTHLSRRVAYDPAWSPDGSSIAYVSTETGGDEIYIYDLGQKSSRRLTDSSGLGFPFNKRPSWSPDSKRLAFYSSRSGHLQIWAVNSDGSNLLNLSDNSFDEQDPVWVKP